MPITPPALDDRSFEDLVQEMLARIPAHTPEWTDPRVGDPGRTLIELFAWLADTLLYRANLVPEHQRLAFLRLLGVPLRPATAARGIVALSPERPEATDAVCLRPGATLPGPAPFESLSHVTVLPVTAETYYKRRLTPEEEVSLRDVVVSLGELYGLDSGALNGKPKRQNPSRNDGRPVPYVTTACFAGGRPEPGGFDLAERSVDRSLWLALLAGNPEVREAVRATLGSNLDGGRQVINLGIVPALEVPGLFEDIGPRARIPHVWEATFLNQRNELDFITLETIDDTTAGLTRSGIVRLLLPAAGFIGAPTNDVSRSLHAGVGDSPPRIDAPETDERLVTWLRLRPTGGAERIDLAWAGINAVEIDQRVTLRSRVVGQSDGSADQVFPLPRTSVEAESLVLEVEEQGRGYQPWHRIDHLSLAQRADPVFVLDSEAGTVQFGDGVRGRVPEQGRRIRVAIMRAGGGPEGNLPPDTLKTIEALDLVGRPVTGLSVTQPLTLQGGDAAESLASAECRIPALFRHANRAVTADDYRQLALETPGVRQGRVEVMPRFKPQQRRFGVPGAVSVMVLPHKQGHGAPNPRADRPMLESVHAQLDARRPLATELYVIGCEYVALGLGASVTVRNGFGREEVLSNVREALRRFMWPLSPGGLDGQGWPLGGAVRQRELEVVIAQVPGVSGVIGVNLFRREDDDWRAIPGAGAAEMTLEAWQLPELLGLIVTADEEPPGDLGRVPSPFAENAIAIPVVPEECD